MDAAVHFVLYEGSQILIKIGALFIRIPTPSVAARHGFVLKQAVTAFIANGAVVGVVQHETLDDELSKGQRLRMGGGNHHAVLGRHHAAHVDSLSDGPQ